ncbi:MAG: plastocyanin/azurin family copper-binding protein [Bacteroidota bacterium]
MDKRIIYILVFIILLASCGQGDGNENSQQDISKNVKPAENNETSVPGIEKLEFTDTIKLKAGEDMRFDNDLFRVKAGKKITLVLKNTGMKSGAMVHNVVVLNSGTDIPDFAEEARKASKEEYIPASFSSSIIAHTKSISGQQSDKIEFTIQAAGVYDFICSYPGHWGTMQGKIVAE